MNKIKEAYKDIMPAKEDKEKMFLNIISQKEETLKMKKKTKVLIPAALAAAVMLAVFVSPVIGKEDENTALPQESASSDSAPMPPQIHAASPMPGMRKFLNYNGHRYEFINDGTVFSEEAFPTGKSLGILENDIAADPAANGKLNMASSFAAGKEIFELEGYDPFFRIAVKGDEGLYICQNVDNFDGSDVDIKEFLEKADLENKIKEIDIYDHFQREILNTIPEDKASILLEVLKESKNTELSNEDYEAIAKSQTEGRSFKISLSLTDGTDYMFYVIPQMKIVMIGDNKYLLSDNFNEYFGEYFEGLTQGPAIMY